MRTAILPFMFIFNTQLLLIGIGYRIVSAEVAADRPDKEWMFLPALALLLAVVALQRRRGSASAAKAMETAA
jgi:TRAP-type uncharacterized transport system fused permease subunit